MKRGHEAAVQPDNQQVVVQDRTGRWGGKGIEGGGGREKVKGTTRLRGATAAKELSDALRLRAI